MNRYNRFLALVVVALLGVCSLSAQEQITTEELARNVSTYYADSYASNSLVIENDRRSKRFDVNAPSLNNVHSLQLGGGLPGMSLMVALDLFFVDEDKSPQYPTTLSDILADRRYYWTEQRAVTSLTLDYGYRVRDGLSLGVKSAVGFTTRSRRHVATNEVLYRDDRVVATLLFNMRFDWLHKPNVMMYSSFGIGAMSIFDYYGGLLCPMFDATYVGITVGRGFYGFFELGAGASGTLRAGVGCRF